MAVPGTSAEFVACIQRSGLVEGPQLDGYLQSRWDGGDLPEPPNKLASALVRDGLLTYFQAEQLLLGKWRNFVLKDKYKILERLGSGGMGTVFLCEHTLLQRPVAVKVLPAEHASNPSVLERFRREARAVARLNHANIIGVHDIDQSNKMYFLVMEYVDGASLQYMVHASGPMDPVRAAHYIRQAALGLQHAHEAGLVHRDVKPGNILVERTGTVKILDLGLARFFHDENDNITLKYDSASVLGTADYLAPEQVEDSHAVDIRADIYSLGATFYYLLAGHPPFKEGTTAQKLAWHRTRPPTPLQSIRTDLPDGLVAIIDRMMAKDPNQRFQTPAELAEALVPWTSTAIGPPPEKEMPRLSSAARSASAEKAP
jgi:serine/threonine protein kinase